MSQKTTSDRILQMIPGLITWSVLLSPILLARPMPLAIAFFITFVTVFWVYRAFVHSVGMIIGYRKYLKYEKENWYQKYLSLDKNELPDSQDLPEQLSQLKHLIVTPVVNENMQVLEGTFKGVATQTYPQEHIYFAISAEEKYHKTIRKTISELKLKYPQVQNVWLFIHPAGIPGEVRGASTNRTWGAKSAVERIHSLGMNIDDFLVTTMDGDAVLSAQYLALLSYEYVNKKERRDHFFSTALYLTNNNIWDVPTLMRIQANSVTLATLSGWVMEPFFKETFSNFSLSLKILVEADYWDTTISIDDTTLFWRIFNNRHGNFRGAPLYVPVSSDAVQGKTFIGSHVQQYKQLLRWGWGIITFPMAVRGLLAAKKLSISERMLWGYHFLERFAIWYTIIILITFGFPLIILFNPGFRTSTFAFLLPQITSTLLTVALLFLIPAAWFRQKLTPPMPKDWPWWKRVYVVFEGVLVIIHLFTYIFLPFVQAQTQFMFGKRMEKFEFTPKFRSVKKN